MIPLYLLWITVVSATLLSVCTTVYFYRRNHTRQLKVIHAMAQQLAQGKYSSRLNIYSKNELNDVSRSLNELALQFENRLTEITHDKEKLEAILSSMVEGVMVVANNGRLQHISPNLCHMLELRSKDVKGRLYWEAIWNQEINNAIKEALNDQKTVRKEIHIITPQENFFNMQVSVVLGPERDLINVVAVFHDITELKRLERNRSEFVANVSHELKTPLTAIKGFVETLQHGDTDAQSSRRFLDIIAMQAKRLENLVNDLLILSSIESREVKMEITPCDIVDIINGVVQIQDEQIKSKEQSVIVKTSTQLPKVLVDRQRIEQVFINLIDNAVKFTPRQGQITLEAREQNEFIRVDVSDSGIGIAPEHLSRLFERFYRVDNARGRDTGGTGLGLAIVKHIINAHQGRISVASTPSAGSTFSIYLPKIKD